PERQWRRELVQLLGWAAGRGRCHRSRPQLRRRLSAAAAHRHLWAWCLGAASVLTRVRQGARPKLQIFSSTDATNPHSGPPSTSRAILSGGVGTGRRRLRQGKANHQTGGIRLRHEKEHAMKWKLGGGIFTPMVLLLSAIAVGEQNASNEIGSNEVTPGIGLA